MGATLACVDCPRRLPSPPALTFPPAPWISGLLRDKDGHLTGGRRAGAGFMAGVTEALILVTPFEVVKIRLQQQTGVDKASLKYKARERK